MIPYSRPKLSEFYNLFESKFAENHIPFTAAHTYIAQKWEYLPRDQTIFYHQIADQREEC